MINHAKRKSEVFKTELTHIRTENLVLGLLKRKKKDTVVKKNFSMSF